MTQINLRVEDEVKRSAEEACEELGMSMSTAITIFLKKMGREKRIPFEVSVDPFYSKENMRYLESVKRDIDSGKAHFAEHALIEED